MSRTMLASPEILNGQIMTADSYLSMEREGIREFQGKYELFNQKIRFMAGASQAHNTIAGNILTLLKMFIWQQNLSAYVNQSDMKVISFLRHKNYFYPDIVFAEGELIYDDIKKDVLINPTLLIEVLSDETESFDRAEKFRSYRQVESLNEYLLVSQYEKKIEQFYKNQDGDWVVGAVFTEGVLPLQSVPYSLQLEQVYRQVVGI
jgi:Uma2 family endonuclease